MITQLHANALLSALAHKSGKGEEERRLVFEGIDILSEIATGERRILTAEQCGYLVDLFGRVVGNGMTVGVALGEMLSERGMSDEAMNDTRMEIYLALNDMAGKKL